MIIENFFDLVMILPNLLLNGIGIWALELDWSNDSLFNGVWINELHSVVWVTGYIFPVVSLVPVFQIYVAFDGLRIVTALLVRAKSFIPIPGMGV
jgi:hypothetical protein